MWLLLCTKPRNGSVYGSVYCFVQDSVNLPGLPFCRINKLGTLGKLFAKKRCKMKLGKWLLIALAVIVILCLITVAVQAQTGYLYHLPVRAWTPHWVYYGQLGYGGYWVINHGPFGGYYPDYYDIDLSRLSRRGRYALGGAVLGGVIGTLADGKKGVAIGIGAGALGGLIFSGRGDGRSERPIILAPGREPSRKIYFRSFRIFNSSSFVAELYDGNRYLGRLEPGDTMVLREPRDHFRAVILMPMHGGRISRRLASLEETDDGWEIVHLRK